MTADQGPLFYTYLSPSVQGWLEDGAKLLGIFGKSRFRANQTGASSSGSGGDGQALFVTELVFIEQASEENAAGNRTFPHREFREGR